MRASSVVLVILLVVVGLWVVSYVYQHLPSGSAGTVTSVVASTVTTTVTRTLPPVTVTSTVTSTVTESATETITATETVTETRTVHGEGDAYPVFMVLKNETVVLEPKGMFPALAEAYPVYGFGDCIIIASSNDPFDISVSTGFYSKVDGYLYQATVLEKQNITNLRAWVPAAGTININIHNHQDHPITIHILIACRWLQPYNLESGLMKGYGYVEHGILPPPSPGHDTISN